MAELAREIEVRAAGPRDGRFLINGEEFPWHIAEDGVTWSLGALPTVTVTILAEAVTIEHSLNEPERDDLPFIGET